MKGRVVPNMDDLEWMKGNKGIEKSLVLADCRDFDEENEPWTLSCIFHVNIHKFNVLLYGHSTIMKRYVP